MTLRLAGCEARCPACEHREISKEASEASKSEWLGRALAPWRERVEKVRGADDARRSGYREKACLAAEWRDGAWRFGVRLRRTRESPIGELVAIPRCPVQSARTNAILAVLSTELVGGIPLVFASVAGSLVTLVLKSAQLPPNNELFAREDALAALAEAGATGLFANLNPAAGRRVFSPRGWKLLWGEGSARGGDGFFHGPESFQQLLPELHEAALDETVSFLEPGEGDFVVDLCSGLGASLRRWKECGAGTLGAELSGEAVRFTARNAGEGLCLQGRAAERIPQLAERVSQARGRVLAYANPPRTGLERETVQWLVQEARPERIAYLSCSAGTLARDLSIFESGDYVVKRIIPYDFFPQTRHVETLACLELDSSAPLRSRIAQRGDARTQ